VLAGFRRRIRYRERRGDEIGLRVLIADDQPLIRTGIRGALAGVDDIEVVGEASTDTQLLPLISRTSPDVVLLDLHLPEADGMSCLEELRASYPHVKVIVLADTDHPSEIMAVLQRGACGYVLKRIDPFDLAGAIRQAVRGTVYSLGGLPFPDRMRPSGDPALSDRELEVLQRVAAGLSNRAIAKDLWLSDQTVKFHLQKIYRKLGVANRTEAARYAYELGLS
jgi:DNA-binding NarL/FixJ family response regulator